MKENVVELYDELYEFVQILVIQLFSLACNAEDVTSFSEISEKERQNIARVLFMKRENLRRSSAPSR